MTAYPAWTPASRAGIIPLHPLGFGTILGRAFAALRHNPRVLLGFALGVQTVAYLLVLLGVAGVALATFTRLDTVREGTDAFAEIVAGSTVMTAAAALILGLAAGALGVIIQGVVVSEVAHAAVAEKLTLKMLWRRVKPVAWRLIGYALLLSAVAIVVLGALVAIVVALGSVALPVAVALTVLLILGAIPLSLWLSTKLVLTPAIIILEHATIPSAMVRSWRLIRGRFWPALGITVLIALIFGAIGQAVGLPFSFLASGLTTIISPTGDLQPGTLVALLIGGILTQAITLAIQAVSVVVQSTAAALIYIDCRMRREGLDLDLLAYVERRDAGAPVLVDPYREHIGRELAPRWATPAYAAPYPPTPQGWQPPPPPAPSPPPAQGRTTAAPSPGPAPTQWTAPGAPPAGGDSPWG